MDLWWHFGRYNFYLMADELTNEIHMFNGDMEGMSRPPRETGSWNAFARIYDINGISCLCQLYDTQLVPYERIDDFKLDFEGLPDGHHASFAREVGVVFGAYDLNVIELNPIRVRATADTVIWNVPKFVPEESPLVLWWLCWLVSSLTRPLSHPRSPLGWILELLKLGVPPMVMRSMPRHLVLVSFPLLVGTLASVALCVRRRSSGLCHGSLTPSSRSLHLALLGQEVESPLGSLLMMAGTSSRSPICVFLASRLHVSSKALTTSISTSASSISGMQCPWQATCRLLQPENKVVWYLVESRYCYAAVFSA